MQTIKANGITINYQVDGPAGAPWIVLSNSLATNLAMCIANLRICARPVVLKSLRVLSAGQITINVRLLITSVISWPEMPVGASAMDCAQTALSTAVLYCDLLLNAGLVGSIRHGNDGEVSFSPRVMLLFNRIHFPVGFSQQPLGINAILRVKGCAQAE